MCRLDVRSSSNCLVFSFANLPPLLPPSWYRVELVMVGYRLLRLSGSGGGLQRFPHPAWVLAWLPAGGVALATGWWRQLRRPIHPSLPLFPLPPLHPVSRASRSSDNCLGLTTCSGFWQTSSFGPVYVHPANWDDI